MKESYNKKLLKKVAAENLPRSIFVSEEDPRKTLRASLDSALSDSFMVFLAILMIPLILLPIFFELSPDIVSFFEVCDFVIICIFIVEYVSKLYAAKNRWQHFKNPWHILDLIIVIIPIVEFFEIVQLNIASASVALRLLRIPRILRVSRAFAVSGRTIAGRLRTQDRAHEEKIAELQMKIRVVDGSFNNIIENVSLEHVKKYMNDTRQEWIDIYDITEKNYEDISKLFDIPVLHVQNKMIEEIHPHIDQLGQVSIVFLQSSSLQYPGKTNKYLAIPRTGFLVICKGTDITTLSKKKSDLIEKVADIIKDRDISKNLVISVLYGIFEHLIKNYRTITTAIEEELLKIENAMSLHIIPKDFLERTFQFKKELGGLGSNLLHLKEVLNSVVQNRVTLEGFNENLKGFFQDLLDELSYLYEFVQDLKENLMSIIDLHINRTAYDTNKVMKVLAVITCLAIIPSMIGGLLGQNLLDAPFTAYLWQIVAYVFIGMGLIVYIFYKLGWLKS